MRGEEGGVGRRVKRDSRELKTGMGGDERC